MTQFEGTARLFANRAAGGAAGGASITDPLTLRYTESETHRVSQKMSMTNLGLELLRFHHSNKYK